MQEKMKKIAAALEYRQILKYVTTYSTFAAVSWQEDNDAKGRNSLSFSAAFLLLVSLQNNERHAHKCPIGGEVAKGALAKHRIVAQLNFDSHSKDWPIL